MTKNLLFGKRRRFGGGILCASAAVAVVLGSCWPRGHQVGGPKAMPAAKPTAPPRGPFGLSLVSTSDGRPLSISGFGDSEDCAGCHPRQWDELKGSAHSIAHLDSLYRRTAELARREAGEEVYAYCAGCHTPQGVASGLVPATAEEKLPDVVKAGVGCDTCHRVGSIEPQKPGWGEPGNASLVLGSEPSPKYGPPGGDNQAAEHLVETRAYFRSAEFCASCHTVIHPGNGLRIEHTYAEWKRSVYADQGIVCQDCHMRTAAQAKQVAATLVPVKVIGKSTEDGADRQIAHHLFAGGNAHIDRLGGGAGHGEIAGEMLRQAARLELRAPPAAAPGSALELEVVVTNIGAGHNLPTSLTELREMWVELTVSAGPQTLLRSGWLDEQGDIEGSAMRFGAHGGDGAGRLTYKPWELTQFLWKRLIPPKASERDRFRVPVPAGAAGPLVISARLLYRSAPPKVLKALFAGQEPSLPAVEMTRSRLEVPLSPAAPLGRG